MAFSIISQAGGYPRHPCLSDALLPRLAITSLTRAALPVPASPQAKHRVERQEEAAKMLTLLRAAVAEQPPPPGGDIGEPEVIQLTGSEDMTLTGGATMAAAGASSPLEAEGIAAAGASGELMPAPTSKLVRGATLDDLFADDCDDDDEPEPGPSLDLSRQRVDVTALDVTDHSAAWPSSVSTRGARSESVPATHPGGRPAMRPRTLTGTALPTLDEIQSGSVPIYGSSSQGRLTTTAKSSLSAAVRQVMLSNKVVGGMGGRDRGRSSSKARAYSRGDSGDAPERPAAGYTSVPQPTAPPPPPAAATATPPPAATPPPPPPAAKPPTPPPSFSNAPPPSSGTGSACGEYRVDMAAARFGDCAVCGLPKAAHALSAIPAAPRSRCGSAAADGVRSRGSSWAFASAPSAEPVAVACDDYRMDLTSPKAGVCVNCGLAKVLHARAAMRGGGGGGGKVMGPAVITRVESAHAVRRASRVAKMQALLKQQSEQLAVTANYRPASQRVRFGANTSAIAADTPSEHAAPPAPIRAAEEPMKPTAASSALAGLSARDRSKSAPERGGQQLTYVPRGRDAARTIGGPLDAADYRDHLATRGRLGDRMLRKQHSSVGRSLLTRASGGTANGGGDDDDDDDDDGDDDDAADADNVGFSSEEDDEEDGFDTAAGTGDESRLAARTRNNSESGKGALQSRASLVWGADGNASRYKRTHL